jgi:hypothetical protein
VVVAILLARVLILRKAGHFFFKKHLAEHQGIPLDSINLLNFSQGGASNDYIVRTLIEQISHTQIRPELVLAGFTHIDRFELFGEKNNIAYQFLPRLIENQKWSGEAEEKRKAAELYLVATNRDDDVARFAKNVLLLQNYCQSRQIPLLCLFFEQRQWSDESPSDFISRISTANTAAFLDAIDTKCCATLNNKMMVDKAADNSHPGPKSQELIAESLWKTFKNSSYNNLLRTVGEDRFPLKALPASDSKAASKKMAESSSVDLQEIRANLDRSQSSLSEIRERLGLSQSSPK